MTENRGSNRPRPIGDEEDVPIPGVGDSSGRAPGSEGGSRTSAPRVDVSTTSGIGGSASPDRPAPVSDSDEDPKLSEANSRSRGARAGRRVLYLVGYSCVLVLATNRIWWAVSGLGVARQINSVDPRRGDNNFVNEIAFSRIASIIYADQPDAMLPEVFREVGGGPIPIMEGRRMDIVDMVGVYKNEDGEERLRVSASARSEMENQLASLEWINNNPSEARARMEKYCNAHYSPETCAEYLLQFDEYLETHPVIRGNRTEVRIGLFSRWLEDLLTAESRVASQSQEDLQEKRKRAQLLLEYVQQNGTFADADIFSREAIAERDRNLRKILS